MFSIVISSDGTAWETDQLMRIDASRFTEYSGSDAEAISADDPTSLAAVGKFPTLLMYEKGTTTGPNPDLVRYGFPREIRRSGQHVVFRFEEHAHLARSVIEENAIHLSIHRCELNRTHWAIKDGGIPGEPETQ